MARGARGGIAFPLAMARPVTAFPAAGAFGIEGKAGNIGTGLLRRSRVVFDYSRRLV